MKKSITMALVSYILVFAMILSMCTIAASAADGNSGKYLKDVFIAYGQTKEQAEQWLRDNGWEPFEDLNDGKSSKAKTNAVAVMGIKRTNDPNEAITDIAAMNMKGGYSFDDYESLVAQKKADITEFINSFIPALNEYRDNYNGRGSKGGKKRAQMAHDLLNKFYDGDPKGKDAVNDTGKPLGDLLLKKTKAEIGDNKYNALSADQKLNVLDLQQMILESSGPAVLIVEQALALATDTSEYSWLDRLDGLTGEKLVERIEEFAPEAIGQDLAPSAAMSLLAAHFEDYSKKLAAEWINVHEDIVWYEEYCTENNLWPDEGEVLSDRAEAHFIALSKEDDDRYSKEYNKFILVYTYYNVLSDIAYSGEWGNTLLDFFRPKDEKADYTEKINYFAPLAAALSDGQRAALQFISLSTLLRLGMDSDSVVESDFPSVDSMFKDEKGKTLGRISIYSGINRAIFRKGVALTSDALEQKNLGRDPYEEVWDEGGIVDIISYSAFAAGAVSMAVGIGMTIKGAQVVSKIVESTKITAANSIPKLQNLVRIKADGLVNQVKLINGNAGNEFIIEKGNSLYKEFEKSAKKLWEAQQNAEGKGINTSNGFSTAGKWLMGIGGGLMIMAAILKGVQIYKYYNRTFTKIPIMMVDEADIVNWVTDKNGNKKKTTTFDQFVYYEVVKCNRQEIGIHTSAQDGVREYAKWGCGDAADLGADVGKQWLAIYINRSPKKGNPILADTLKLQKGSSKMPADCNACLHKFLYTNPVKIDHRDYCFRQDNDGMYLFWKSDETVAVTASTFTAGYIALAAIGGLAIGIVCTTIVFMAGRKKKKKEHTPEPA